MIYNILKLLGDRFRINFNNLIQKKNFQALIGFQFDKVLKLTANNP